MVRGPIEAVSNQTQYGQTYIHTYVRTVSCSPAAELLEWPVCEGGALADCRSVPNGAISAARVYTTTEYACVDRDSGLEGAYQTPHKCALLTCVSSACVPLQLPLHGLGLLPPRLQVALAPVGEAAMAHGTHTSCLQQQQTHFCFSMAAAMFACVSAPTISGWLVGTFTCTSKCPAAPHPLPSPPPFTVDLFFLLPFTSEVWDGVPGERE